MRAIRVELYLAGGIGLIVLILAYLLEGQITGWGVASTLFGFLSPIQISNLLESKQISNALYLAKAATTVKNAAVSRAATRALQKRTEMLSGLSQGRLKLTSIEEMLDAYYDVFELEKSKRILATSVVSIREVWTPARGRRALEVNKQAIDRGIEIHRVFIFQNEDAVLADESQAEMRRHSDAGVKVHYVTALSLDRGLATDFLVTDSDVYIEYTVDGQGRIVEGTMCDASNRANELRQMHKSISSAATMFNA